MLVRTNLVIQFLVKEPNLSQEQYQEESQDTMQPEETQELSDEDLIHDLKSSLNSSSSSQQEQHYLITSQPAQLVKKISCLLFSKPPTSNLSTPSSVLLNRPLPAQDNTSSVYDESVEQEEIIYYKRREDYLPNHQDSTPKSARSLSIHKVLGKKTATKIYPGPQQHPQDGMPVIKLSDNKTKALFKRMKNLVRHRKK